MPPSETAAVLSVRVDALEEWRRDHAKEDDDKFEGLDERVRSLEISRARILGYAAGAAAGGAALMQVIIQLVSDFVK